MAVEDTFNGAKSGLTFLNAYINTVAGVIGEEQAHALETATCQALGTSQGMMIKDQIGVEIFDLKSSSKVLQNLIEEGFGIRSEVIEETPQTIKINVGRCPVYESMQALGMDEKAIEASCRGGSLGFMDAVAKQLNPDLSYELVKFRSSADDYCEEIVVLA
jgi:hypothetical protein